MSIYRNIIISFWNKSEREFSGKNTPNSPDWCSIRPTLVATLCSSLSGGKHFHPYLQWSVFFVSLLTGVSPTPRSTPPENQRLEPENTPLGKRRNIKKPTTNSMFRPSMVPIFSLSFNIKGASFGSFNERRCVESRDTPLWLHNIRSLKETNC